MAEKTDEELVDGRSTRASTWRPPTVTPPQVVCQAKAPPNTTATRCNSCWQKCTMEASRRIYVLVFQVYAGTFVYVWLPYVGECLCTYSNFHFNKHYWVTIFRLTCSRLCPCERGLFLSKYCILNCADSVVGDIVFIPIFRSLFTNQQLTKQRWAARYFFLSHILVTDFLHVNVDLQGLTRLDVSTFRNWLLTRRLQLFSILSPFLKKKHTSTQPRDSLVKNTHTHAFFFSFTISKN